MVWRCVKQILLYYITKKIHGDRIDRSDKAFIDASSIFEG
jgi:hypothetical protein